MRKWKLEDAKNRFSQLVRETLREGPQLVTRNGHDAVVVVSATEYARLTSPRGLTAFLRDSPRRGSGLMQVCRSGWTPGRRWSARSMCSRSVRSGRACR